MPYVSRAGAKLDYALNEFKLDVTGWVCADLGCSTGGFTDCLLQRRAARVFCVDTGYGVLAYRLRIDPRIAVMERTNALHVTLPEAVDLVTVDVGWTRQALILPRALALVKSGGSLVSLVKPHYEANTAHLSPAEATGVFDQVLTGLKAQGIVPQSWVKSPVLGEKAGNTEYLIWIKKA